MVFYRLAKFKYHVKHKCKQRELFSKKVEFLGHSVSAARIDIVESTGAHPINTGN